MAAGIGVTALFPLFIGPVPITLQDCLIIGCGVFLGPKDGAKAVALYILAGCIGLPIFSGGRGGIAHLLGPTGGYLLGFIFLAFCTGLTAYTPFQRNNPFRWIYLSCGCILGYFGVFSIGALWIAYTLKVPLATALVIGVIPFLPVTLLKLLILFIGLYLFYPQIYHVIPYASSKNTFS